MEEKRKGLLGRLVHAKRVIEAKKEKVQPNVLDIRLKNFVLVGTRGPWDALNGVLEKTETEYFPYHTDGLILTPRATPVGMGRDGTMSGRLGGTWDVV